MMIHADRQSVAEHDALMCLGRHIGANGGEGEIGDFRLTIK
jgi:hypothetical protein